MRRRIGSHVLYQGRIYMVGQFNSGLREYYLSPQDGSSHNVWAKEGEVQTVLMAIIRRSGSGN